MADQGGSDQAGIGKAIGGFLALFMMYTMAIGAIATLIIGGAGYGCYKLMQHVDVAWR